MFMCPLEASLFKDICVYVSFGSIFFPRYICTCINWKHLFSKIYLCMYPLKTSLFQDIFWYVSIGSIMISNIYLCMYTLEASLLYVYVPLFMFHWNHLFSKIYLFMYPLDASIFHDIFVYVSI